MLHEAYFLLSLIIRLHLDVECSLELLLGVFLLEKGPGSTPASLEPRIIRERKEGLFSSARLWDSAKPCSALLDRGTVKDSWNAAAAFAHQLLSRRPATATRAMCNAWELQSEFCPSCPLRSSSALLPPRLSRPS